MMHSEIVIRKAVMADWEETMAMTWRTFLKFEAKDYGVEGVENFRNFIFPAHLEKQPDFTL